MRPSRRVVCSSLLLFVFTTGGTPIRAWSSEHTSSQDYSRYQSHIVQIERVARRLLETVPQPPPVQFILAAGEPTINAGATFGKVILSSGMMDFLRSDDELAMILGHELAHITQGHVARGTINSALLGIGSSLASAVFPGVGTATNVVGRLFLNHFNQEQELEADRVGLQYATDAGYDSRAGEVVMRRLAEEVPQSATAGFFSSHPSSVERAGALKKRADQLTLRSDRARQAGGAPRFGRDEAACRRARPHFYRARESLNLAEKAALYRRGLRQCPERPRAHFELAETYIQMAQDRRAAVELRAVLRYDTGYPRAQRRLREVERRLSSGKNQK